MNYKVYISGGITGKSRDLVQSEFAAAEDLWCAIGGVDVVNPLNNGLDISASWRDHMKADTAMLWDCDAVYFLPGWESSRGCRIEYQIAVESGMAIFLAETGMVSIETYKAINAVTTRGNINILLKIAQAVRQVSGITFSQIQQRRRTHANIVARMIFANECRRLMPVGQIAKVMNTNCASVRWLLRKFNHESRWNGQFDRMANEVKEIIKS